MQVHMKSMNNLDQNDQMSSSRYPIRDSSRRHYVQCYYTDELGFYRYLDPDRLHYVCSNLNPANRESANVRVDGERGFETYYREIRNDLGISHFDRLDGYQEWKSGWDAFIKEKLTSRLPATLNQSLKKRVRSGIPHDYRPKVWSAMIRMRTRNIRLKTGDNIYNSVLKDLTAQYAKQINLTDDLDTNEMSSEFMRGPDGKLKRVEQGSRDFKTENPHQMEVFFRQIELDLLRTLPNNCHFESITARGIQRVRRVLRAYAMFNPSVGYCQGMNRLAAMALLILPEEEAFWCLVTIVQCIMPKDYYLKPWLAQIDCCVLNDLLEKKMPSLHKHLVKNNIQLTLFTWFFTIFVDGVRPELIFRIWDCFLLEGDEVLFRFALAILYIAQENLLRMDDFSSMSSYLNELVSTRKMDVEYLFQGKFKL